MSVEKIMSKILSKVTYGRKFACVNGIAVAF